MGLVCTTCNRKFQTDSEINEDLNDESTKYLYEYLERKRANFLENKKNLRKQSKQSAVLESASIYWSNRRNMSLSDEHRPVITYKIKNINSLMKKKNLIVTIQVFLY